MLRYLFEKIMLILDNYSQKKNFSYLRNLIGRKVEIFFDVGFHEGETAILANKYFSIKEIPVRSRFSILVARRLYQKIGNYILKKKNKENYIRAGKIYGPLYRKILETLFSLFDFIHILFINKNNQSDQLLTIENIDIDERI